MTTTKEPNDSRTLRAKKGYQHSPKLSLYPSLCLLEDRMKTHRHKIQRAVVVETLFL